MKYINKLLRNIHKFIQPTKYKLDYVLKPIKTLKKNDKVFLLFIQLQTQNNFLMSHNTIQSAVVKNVNTTEKTIELFINTNCNPLIENEIYNLIISKSINFGIQFKLYAKLNTIKKHTCIAINTQQGILYISTDKNVLKKIIIQNFKNYKKYIKKQIQFVQNTIPKNTLYTEEYITQSINTFRKNIQKIFYKLYSL